jgi:site-specific recombinase XerD
MTTRMTLRPRQRVDQLTLTDLVQYFEFHNRTEGKSSKTVTWYNESLGLFERFLVQSGMSTLLRDIGEEEVRAFIADLQSRHKWADSPRVHSTERLSGEGIQNRVRALKAFFAWLHREGHTESNRLAGLRNYKAP